MISGLLILALLAAADSLPGKPVPILGNDHIERPDSPHRPYNSNPPTSGPHTPFIARWGIYRGPIPKEVQVHNLEDGGVVLNYNCSRLPKGASCESMRQALEKVAAGYLSRADQEKKGRSESRFEHLLLAPYPEMDSAIALTAWGRIDKFNEFEEGRVRRFIEAFIGIDHHPAHE